MYYYNMKTVPEIRQDFIDFFRDNGHKYLFPSKIFIPENILKYDVEYRYNVREVDNFDIYNNDGFYLENNYKKAVTWANF